MQVQNRDRGTVHGITKDSLICLGKMTCKLTIVLLGFGKLIVVLLGLGALLGKILQLPCVR